MAYPNLSKVPEMPKTKIKGNEIKEIEKIWKAWFWNIIRIT